MMDHLKRLWQEEEGQDLVEYGLLLFLLALTAIAAVRGVGSAVASVFTNAATSLTSGS